MNNPKGHAVWHPFTQHGLEETFPLVERAEGAILHTADGRRIIDAISSWWVTTHGHCHPRIVEAISRQAGNLDQIIFAGWTHEPAERLACELLTMMPDGLAHVFFSDSGSTAVEVALKMALGHWHNRGEARHRVLVLDHSYHGDTIGTMSVGARGIFNRAYAPLLFDVTSLPFPHEGGEQATLDALEVACARGDTACFLVEPLVLGAGGMLVYPAHVLARMREICAVHGVLFIADEVMTGWGRTGTLTACEQAGIVPDLMCLAKGLTGGSLPLAVTLASPAVFDSHYSTDRARQLFHSSSYTANPIACAAALANLAIWREEPVMERITALAAAQRQGLATLSGLPRTINARQCGTILAIDVERGDAGYLSQVAPHLQAHFREANVLLRPLGNTVYIMPPYCICADDLNRVHAVIAEAIAALA